MNQFTIYIDKDLTHRWNEFPKEENFVDFENDFHESKYSAALQKAKGEAIPFEDDKIKELCYIQNKNLVKINASYGEWWLKITPDSFVTIDYDGTVEVVEKNCGGKNCPGNDGCWGHPKGCGWPDKVARLIPSKPNEEKPLPESIQQLSDAIERKGVKIAFGLEAQGHISTIENEIKRLGFFPTDEWLWERIAKQIGWVKWSALAYYAEYLFDKSQSSTPEKPDNSKPDFEAMANNCIEQSDFEWMPTTKRAIVHGMEYLWTTYHLPKVREMEERIQELETLIQETPDWIITDFKAGANWGLSQLRGDQVRLLNWLLDNDYIKTVLIQTGGTKKHFKNWKTSEDVLKEFHSEVISSEPTQEELWKELIALTMIRRPWSEIQSKFEINRKKS